MSDQMRTWVDLPLSEAKTPEAIMRLIQTAAQFGEFQRMRMWAYDENEVPEPRDRIGGPDQTLASLSSQIVDQFFQTLSARMWPRFSCIFRLRASALEGLGHPGGLTFGIEDRVDPVNNEPLDGRPASRLGGLPPALWGRAYPVAILTHVAELQVSFGFRSLLAKNLVERIWWEHLKAVDPLRLVVVVRPSYGDWRDESGADIVYYRDPLDLASTMKMLFGFRLEARELARVLSSRKFLDSLPPWRKTLDPAGALPERGLLLRWRWRAPEFLDDRETPDGSPPLMDLFKAALADQGLDDTSEITWGRDRGIELDGTKSRRPPDPSPVPVRKS